jgi:hypothetical protein
LEERFASSLTGIGVHAGKYSTERVTERIAEACDRLGVEHAVVNDRQFRTWKEYAVNAWPTVVVIDPEGYIALIAPGEFDLESIAAELEKIERRAEERGTLVRGPDPVAVAMPHHAGSLRFPTRAILGEGKLWVADTGHGRVLECAWFAEERRAVLLAEHGGFLEPRGLAVLGGSMYVADRAGHSVWRLGGAERVRVAGTGEMGAWKIAEGDAVATALRSPWGLAAYGERLAIAMAGSHQLWSLDPGTGRLALLAGTGAEAIADGPAPRSALAQPTGLAPAGRGGLAFADCESSAVRLLSSASVQTLVGTDLFDFGDRAGVGDAALLQHCEDVAVHGDVLAVADTYNDRLKLVDPVTRECVPWHGEAGEKGSLREPGGVWSDGATLLVADTGNHRVAVVEASGAVTEVEIEARA